MTDEAQLDPLRSMTKTMLLDQTRRIELDELVVLEVHRVAAILNDVSFGAGPLGGSRIEVDAALATKAIEAWDLVRPFCGSLQLAARYAAPEDLAPWVYGVRAFVESTTRDGGGIAPLTALRHVPASFTILTAGVAAVSAQKWENLKALVMNPLVTNRYDQSPLAILEATDPFKAFGNGGSADAMLAYAARNGITVDDVVAELGTDKVINSRGAEPMQWANRVLHALFADSAPDETTWNAEFIRAEVFLGLLAEDAYLHAPAVDGGRRYRVSHWFGLAANRRIRTEGGPVAEFAYELERDGTAWAPLVAGLFGGSADRAAEVMKSYSEGLDEVARQRPF